MKNRRLALLTFALAVSLPAPRAQAHNGTTGICLPLRGITIDGDLTDWPELLAGESA